MKLTILYLFLSIIQAIQNEIDDGSEDQEKNSSQFVRSTEQNNRLDINNQNEGEELPITTEESLPARLEECLSVTSEESSYFASEEDLSETSSDENLHDKCLNKTSKKIVIKNPVQKSTERTEPEIKNSSVREVPTYQRKNDPVLLNSVKVDTSEGEASGMQNNGVPVIPESKTKKQSILEDKKLAIDQSKKQLATQNENSSVIVETEIREHLKDDLSLKQDESAPTISETLTPVNQKETCPVVQESLTPPVNSGAITPVKQTVTRNIAQEARIPPLGESAISLVKQTETRSVAKENYTSPVNSKVILPGKQTETHPVVQKIYPPLNVSETISSGNQTETLPVVQEARTPIVNLKGITSVKQTETLPAVQEARTPPVNSKAKTSVNQTESRPVVQKIYPPLNIPESISFGNQPELRPIVKQERSPALQKNSTPIIPEVRPQRKTVTIGAVCGRSKPLIFLN